MKQGLIVVLNQAQQKPDNTFIEECLKLELSKFEGSSIVLTEKTKTLIRYVITVQLICAFVSAYKITGFRMLMLV